MLGRRGPLVGGMLTAVLLTACSGGSDRPGAAPASAATTLTAYQVCQVVAQDLTPASAALQGLVRTAEPPVDVAGLLMAAQSSVAADSAKGPAALRTPIQDLAGGLGRLRAAVSSGTDVAGLEARTRTDFSDPLKALATACGEGPG